MICYGYAEAKPWNLEAARQLKKINVKYDFKNCLKRMQVDYNAHLKLL